MPPHIDTLGFAVVLEWDRDRTEYIVGWTRALRKASIYSLRLDIDFAYPAVRHDSEDYPEDLALWRDFDAVVASEESGIQHLTLNFIGESMGSDTDVDSYREELDEQHPYVQNAFVWIRHNVFPKTMARFVSNEGTTKYGTKCSITQIWD